MAITTPLKFIEKWQKSTLKERAAAQEHFLDVCSLLEHPTPAEADPKGEWFTFEYGAQKTTGAQGFADVWKKGFFGWEYKGKRKDLQAAYSQLQQYAPALANPPLLIVCDTDRFEIYTNWNDLVSEKHVILLEELSNPDKLNILRYAFFDPDKLKPTKSRQQLTKEVAEKFALIAESLRHRGHDPHQVAHFVNRLIFCMFAEDIKLLPEGIFTALLERCVRFPDELQKKLSSLFKAMKDGATWGPDDILWFNGGLFDDDVALKLEPDEIKMVFDTAKKDWSDIDPSIMGTLFERGLDPAKQSQLGAHYTDRDMIMKIINPVIVDPLTEEWEEVKTKILDELKKADTHKEKGNTTETASQITKALNRARKSYDAFKAKVIKFKVLDPACGSGNFLYLSLKALKDLEQQINIFGEMIFRLPQAIPEVGPENIYGIEINPYAAELARVSVWIGEIQWIKKHGLTVPANPVLRKLNNIVCHDALINPDGSEYQWPKVDAIVGNPPFIGDKKMIRELGEDYTVKIRKTYAGRVSGGADFVCFWFAKCNDYMKAGWLQRAGLVSTNSIRNGKNRLVLDNVLEGHFIYDAWPDEPWVNEGASLRVSMTSFCKDKPPRFSLDGVSVTGIFSDLKPKLSKSSIDLTQAKALPENKSKSFIGVVLVGPFEISDDLALEWLKLPENPNGRKNSEVLRRILNGSDVTGRQSVRWVVDFGSEMPENEASFFEKPFEYVVKNAKPYRLRKNDEGDFAVRRQGHRDNWWRYGESRPAMRDALKGKQRFIATPMVSKHRVFVWLDKAILPDQKLVVFPTESDVVFGILHSNYHQKWSLAKCSWIGSGNDPTYATTSTFEPFPFPKGMEPNRSAKELEKNPKAQKIAEAARRLNELRENWLNPEGCIKRVPEVVAGYPDRILPIDKDAEKILSKRTLTNLYNDNPTWLKNAHKDLDDAVAEAYGWPTDLSDEEILERLFALNQQRGSSIFKKGNL